MEHLFLIDILNTKINKYKQELLYYYDKYDFTPSKNCLMVLHYILKYQSYYKNNYNFLLYLLAISNNSNFSF
jgi:hypothetical protein